MFRRLHPYQYVVDATVALVYFAIGMSLIGIEFFAAATSGSLVIGGYALALACRRVSPALALALTWAFSIAQMMVGLYPNLYNVATVAVVYTTAAYGSRAVRWAGLVSVGIGAFVAATYLAFMGAGLGVSETLFGWSGLPSVAIQLTLLFGALLAVLGPPWLLGLLVRSINATKENRLARGRAERVVAVEQERNRIARDMHDVVAHSLAVVIAQADGARYIRDSDPQAVDHALKAISETARDALDEVRQLLAQLRHNEGEGPQPTLDDLDRLREQFRASGLTIRSVERGTPERLATGKQLAAYRIVQEALTNALRHGDPSAPVELIIAWRHDALELVVTSSLSGGGGTNGSGSGQGETGDGAIDHTATGDGHGIIGMIERATLVGGSVAAHAVGDSFVVVASIPTQPTSAPELLS
ncbi:MAG: sensor histidine kinase [Microbacteriaceae bacterium]